MRAAIIDTGPLTALLDRAERHHRWSVEQFRELNPPALVCEPVLVETMYLLAGLEPAQDALFRMLESGALRVALRMDEHLPALRSLHRKYRDCPMSLADACIVRMAEVHDGHSILTLNSDFRVYRKHGRTPLAVICPPP